MATGMVLSVAQTLFAALKCKELRDLCSMFGFESELEDLKQTVTIIEAVLLSAESKQQELSHEGRDWVESLKDAVYDVDDVLDEFRTMAQQQQQMSCAKISKKVSLFFSRSNKLLVTFKASHDIKKIKNKLDSIAKNRSDFGFGDNYEPVKRRADTCSYVMEEIIIGRDTDKEAVMGMLLDQSYETLFFVTIVGIGGLGKTALAQLVFNDDRVKSAFDLRLWVCVSDDFSMEGILSKMVQKEGLKLEGLQQEVRQKIEGKKYLLVLDDVWEENRAQWIMLRDYLNLGGKGSRVLVTSRSKKVAGALGNNSMYVLGGLSDENSWSLFRRTAFGSRNEPADTILVAIGKEIVKRCANVPLSIRVIGSLLYGQDERKWLLSSQSISQFESVNLSNVGKRQGILPVLKFSYYHLSPSLKSCFSYCALFPKDYVIPKQFLINLWMAQGCLDSGLQDGQSIEDVGEDYFSVLLQRCFLQDIKKNEYDEIESCKMNDLVHDLAQEVAGKEFSVVKTVPIDGKIRHISVLDESLASFVQNCSLDNMYKLRTILMSGIYCPKSIWGRVVTKILAYGRRLRVLKLFGFGIEVIPKTLSNLVHLRYLDLSNNAMEMLPNSVTKLLNLEVLILNSCPCLKELPKDLGNFINLRHLDISGCISLTHMPARLDSLTCLHKLSTFILGKGSSNQVQMGQLQELKHLVQLSGEISIVVQKGYSYDATNAEGGHLVNKSRIKALTIQGGHHEWAHEVIIGERLLEELKPHSGVERLYISGYRDMKLPHWAATLGSSLPLLVSLRLRSFPRLKHLSSLSQLQHLKFLELYKMDSVECMVDGNNDVPFTQGSRTAKLTFFQSLETLEIINLPKLKGCWEDDILLSMDRCGQDAIPSFPRLRYLRIIDCPSMTSFPRCPHLKVVELLNSNKLKLCEKREEASGSQQTCVDESSSSTLASSTFGINPRESKVAFPSRSDLGSLNPVSDIPKNLASGITFMNVPAGASMSKAARDIETEIESDLGKHPSTSELVEIFHDLETELYTSVEDHISTADPVSGPSGKNTVKPELDPSSLNTSIRNRSFQCTDIRVYQEAVEAAEQIQVSHNIENEIQISKSSPSEFLIGQTAVKADVKPTSSFNQSVAVDRISFQAEISETAEVLSLLKVDMKKPIQNTLEKILEAFKDAHHRRICLYGRGGSGKSTVLKNLFHHPETKELFHQVLFVTVPKIAYKKHVQDEIVKQLSLNIKESCTEVEISRLIHQALINNKFLVLLDNVWESISLHEIGIPSPSPENSCWLVLATRCLDASHLMADREIEMEVLSNTEAWEVFSYQVGDVINSPEIERYARAICKECYGSPVIISAIGGALRAESSVKEWKHALKHLKSGDTNTIIDQYCFRRHIKYCYDRLKARDVKTYFLYTALFQEDREIDLSTLVKCLISDGLVSGTATASYNKGHDIVAHLTNASLLEATDNGLKVKMHNVLKDSALDILSSDVEDYLSFVRSPNSRNNEYQSFQESSCTLTSQLPHKYLTRAGAHMKEPPSVQEWEQATMIFLMDNDLSSLPNKPNCSNLVALLLQRNYCLRVIPDSFFDSMSTLKILNLSETRIKTLPDSFRSLSSLQILLLRDCKRFFVLPRSIGSLEFLKVLDLRGTEVTHLPDFVGGLTSLEHLSISFYGSMNHSEYKTLPSKLVSDGIIVKLRRLRELGIFVYPGDRRWTLNASLITKEISNLKLFVLHFHFPQVKDLECFVHESQSWKSRSLTTFSIVVGYDFKRLVPLVSNDAEVLFNEGQRCLRFVNGENITNAVVEVLTRATCFYLDHHLTISKLSQFGVHSFDGLKLCILRDCPELIEIVGREEQERFLFPVLEYLSINNLWKLERLWVGQIAKGSLARLRSLSVHACPKLRYVFTCSMLDTLSNLEELVIEDCASLKYIVIGDNDDEKENKVGLPMLQNLKVLKLHHLPELCGIWRGQWPLLEYISFYDCPLLRNLHMKVNDDVHIKEIAADKAWLDSLIWNDLELLRRLQKCLTQIDVDDL